ncbi:MAG: acyltransferase [Nitriliruptoraceae bacterium]|nr:acyltransferase [Nitriliruptoraceae bacterium]
MTIEPVRDRYPDALRAGALLVVVLGHWVATLPRLRDGRMVDTEHLLTVWQGAGVATWFVQVVPLFVFVSAAVSADGTARRIEAGDRQLHWWGGRALSLARPTVTYLAVLTVLAIVAIVTGGRLLGPLDLSLTIHLWFLLMLLVVQALLPASVRADERFGLGAVAALLAAAVVVDLVRGQVTSPAHLAVLGSRVVDGGGGIGWLNILLVWLLPQQLGIAWRRQRFGGRRMGLGLIVLGFAWLAGTVASGYPTAMVGVDLEGRSNLLPPTLALIGVMWLQVGGVLLAERTARRLLARRRIEKVVGVLGALGMALYLWHKLAELPAAWLGERIGAPIDLGVPGDPGFWWGRIVWLLLCIAMVTPVMAGVIAFETRRRETVPSTTSSRAIVLGGAALMIGIGLALVLGARPGAVLGLVGVAIASATLRSWPGRDRERARQVDTEELIAAVEEQRAHD